MIENNSVGSIGSQTSLSGVFRQSLGQEDFLMLLVAQLKNQDPLSPMESQEFASQLAQFSSLEKLASIDDKIEQGISADLVLAQAINNTLAATLIGREVTSLGNGVALVSGEAAEIHFKLNGNAEEVTITIQDQAGNTVRVLKSEALSSGRQSIEWDGKDNNGRKLPEGDYTFRVEAKDKSGNRVNALPLMVGIISSLRFENGSAVLIVNGAEIAFSDVLEIGLNQ